MAEDTGLAPLVEDPYELIDGKPGEAEEAISGAVAVDLAEGPKEQRQRKEIVAQEDLGNLEDAIAEYYTGKRTITGRAIGRGEARKIARDEMRDYLRNAPFADPSTAFLRRGVGPAAGELVAEIPNALTDAISRLMSGLSEVEEEMGADTAKSLYLKSMTQQDLLVRGVLVGGEQYISPEEFEEGLKVKEIIGGAPTTAADSAGESDFPTLAALGQQAPEIMAAPDPGGTPGVNIGGVRVPVLRTPLEAITRPLTWAIPGAGRAFQQQIVGDPAQTSQNRTQIAHVEDLFANLQNQVGVDLKRGLAEGEFGGDFAETKRIRQKFTTQLNLTEQKIYGRLTRGEFGDYGAVLAVDKKYDDRLYKLQESYYRGEIGDSEALRELGRKYQQKLRRLEDSIVQRAKQEGLDPDTPKARSIMLRRYGRAYRELRNAFDNEVSGAARTDPTVQAAQLKAQERRTKLNAAWNKEKNAAMRGNPSAIGVGMAYKRARDAALGEHKTSLSKAVKAAYVDTPENTAARGRFQAELDRRFEELEHKKRLSIEAATSENGRSIHKYMAALAEWAGEQVMPPVYVPGTTERVGSGEWLMSAGLTAAKVMGPLRGTQLRPHLEAQRALDERATRPQFLLPDADTPADEARAQMEAYYAGESEEEEARRREEMSDTERIRANKEQATQDEMTYQQLVWLGKWRAGGTLMLEEAADMRAVDSGEITPEEYRKRRNERGKKLAGETAETAFETAMAGLAVVLPSEMQTSGEYKGTLIETPLATVVRNVGGAIPSFMVTHIDRASAAAGYSARAAMPVPATTATGTARLPTYAEVAEGAADEPGAARRLGRFAYELMDGVEGIAKVVLYTPALAPFLPAPTKLFGIGDRGAAYLHDVANTHAAFKGLYDSMQSVTLGSKPAIDRFEELTGLPHFDETLRYGAAVLDVAMPFERIGMGMGQMGRSARAVYRGRSLKKYGAPVWGWDGQIRGAFADRYPGLDKRLPDLDPAMVDRIEREMDAGTLTEERLPDWAAQEIIARDDAVAKQMGLIRAALKSEAAAGRHLLPPETAAILSDLIDGVAPRDMDGTLVSPEQLRKAWLDLHQRADSLRTYEPAGPERERVYQELLRSFTDIEGSPHPDMSERAAVVLLALADHHAVQAHLSDPVRYASPDDVYAGYRMSTGDVWVPTGEKRAPLFQRESGIIRDPSIGKKAEMGPAEMGRRPEVNGYLAKAFINRKTGERRTTAPIAQVRGMLDGAPPSVRNEAALLGLFGYLDGLEGRTVSLSDLSRVMDEGLFRVDEMRALERGTLSWVGDQNRLFIDRDVIEGRASFEPYVSPLQDLILTEYSFEDANGGVWRPRRVLRSSEGLSIVELDPPADYAQRIPPKRWVVVSDPMSDVRYTTMPETRTAAVRRAETLAGMVVHPNRVPTEALTPEFQDLRERYPQSEQWSADYDLSVRLERAIDPQSKFAVYEHLVRQAREADIDLKYIEEARLEFGLLQEDAARMRADILQQRGAILAHLSVERDALIERDPTFVRSVEVQYRFAADDRGGPVLEISGVIPQHPAGIAEMAWERSNPEILARQVAINAVHEASQNGYSTIAWSTPGGVSGNEAAFYAAFSRALEGIVGELGEGAGVGLRRIVVGDRAGSPRVAIMDGVRAGDAADGIRETSSAARRSTAGVTNAAVESAVRGTDLENSPEITSDMAEVLNGWTVIETSIDLLAEKGISSLANYDQIARLGDALDPQGLASEIMYGEWSYPDRYALCAVALRRFMDDVVNGQPLTGGFSSTFLDALMAPVPKNRVVQMAGEMIEAGLRALAENYTWYADPKNRPIEDLAAALRVEGVEAGRAQMLAELQVAEARGFITNTALALGKFLIESLPEDAAGVMSLHVRPETSDRPLGWFRPTAVAATNLIVAQLTITHAVPGSRRTLYSLAHELGHALHAFVLNDQQLSVLSRAFRRSLESGYASESVYAQKFLDETRYNHAFTEWVAENFAAYVVEQKLPELFRDDPNRVQLQAALDAIKARGRELVVGRQTDLFDRDLAVVMDDMFAGRAAPATTSGIATRLGGPRVLRQTERHALDAAAFGGPGQRGPRIVSAIDVDIDKAPSTMYQRDPETGVPLGATWMSATTGKVVAEFFRNADFSTISHEIGHIIRLLMPEADAAYGAMLDAFGDVRVDERGEPIRNSVTSEELRYWSVGAEERFAETIERYFESEMSSGDPRVDRIYDELRLYLAETFRRLAREPGAISAKHAEAFERWFADISPYDPRIAASRRADMARRATVFESDIADIEKVQELHADTLEFLEATEPASLVARVALGRVGKKTRKKTKRIEDHLRGTFETTGAPRSRLFGAHARGWVRDADIVYYFPRNNSFLVGDMAVPLDIETMERMGGSLEVGATQAERGADWSERQRIAADFEPRRIREVARTTTGDVVVFFTGDKTPYLASDVMLAQTPDAHAAEVLGQNRAASRGVADSAAMLRKQLAHARAQIGVHVGLEGADFLPRTRIEKVGRSGYPSIRRQERQKKALSANPAKAAEYGISRDDVTNVDPAHLYETLLTRAIYEGIRTRYGSEDLTAITAQSVVPNSRVAAIHANVDIVFRRTLGRARAQFRSELIQRTDPRTGQLVDAHVYRFDELQQEGLRIMINEIHAFGLHAPLKERIRNTLTADLSELSADEWRGFVSAYTDLHAGMGSRRVRSMEGLPNTFYEYLAQRAFDALKHPKILQRSIQRWYTRLFRKERPLAKAGPVFETIVDRQIRDIMRTAPEALEQIRAIVYAADRTMEREVLAPNTTIDAARRKSAKVLARVKAYFSEGPGTDALLRANTEIAPVVNPDPVLRGIVFDRIGLTGDFVEFVKLTRDDANTRFSALRDELPVEPPPETMQDGLGRGEDFDQEMFDHAVEATKTARRQRKAHLEAMGESYLDGANELEARVYDLLLNETDADLVAAMFTVDPDAPDGAFYTAPFYDTGLTRGQAYNLIRDRAGQLFVVDQRNSFTGQVEGYRKALPPGMTLTEEGGTSKPIIPKGATEFWAWLDAVETIFITGLRPMDKYERSAIQRIRQNVFDENDLSHIVQSLIRRKHAMMEVGADILMAHVGQSVGTIRSLVPEGTLLDVYYWFYSGDPKQIAKVANELVVPVYGRATVPDYQIYSELLVRGMTRVKLEALATTMIQYELSTNAAEMWHRQGSRTPSDPNIARRQARINQRLEELEVPFNERDLFVRAYIYDVYRTTSPEKAVHWIEFTGTRKKGELPTPERIEEVAWRRSVARGAGFNERITASVREVLPKKDGGGGRSSDPSSPAFGRENRKLHRLSQGFVGRVETRADVERIAREYAAKFERKGAGMDMATHIPPDVIDSNTFWHRVRVYIARYLNGTDAGVRVLKETGQGNLVQVRYESGVTDPMAFAEAMRIIDRWGIDIDFKADFEPAFWDSPSGDLHMIPKGMIELINARVSEASPLATGFADESIFDRVLDRLDKSIVRNMIARIKQGATVGLVFYHASFSFAQVLGNIAQTHMVGGTDLLWRSVATVFKHPMIVSNLMKRMWGSTPGDASNQVVVFPDGAMTLDEIARECLIEGLDQTFVNSEFGMRLFSEVKAEIGLRSRLWEAIWRVPKILVGLAQAPDMAFRLGIYISERKRGAAAHDAAQTAREAVLDYSDLSDFERKFLRTYLIFYSYQRRNGALVWDTLLKHPERIGMQARLVQKLQQIALEDEEAALANDWSALRLGVAKKIAPNLGKHSIRTLLPPLPIQDYFENMANFFTIPSAESGRFFLNKITPPIDIVAGLMGKDIFTNLPFDHPSNNIVPSSFVAIDQALFGGEFASVFDIKPGSAKDYYDAGSIVDQTVYFAGNAKSWHFFTTLFGIERSIKELAWIDRSDLGLAEELIHLADFGDKLMSQERLNEPGMLTDEGELEALRRANATHALGPIGTPFLHGMLASLLGTAPPQRYMGAGPRLGVGPLAELGGYLGFKPRFDPLSTGYKSEAQRIDDAINRSMPEELQIFKARDPAKAPGEGTP